MVLNNNQKQLLQSIYRLSSDNDSFFTFLDNLNYEKKMKKLHNAKDEYASYSYDEEPLFLLDDTDFGSGDDGIVIATKTIYWKNTFDDPKLIKFEDINSCELIREGGDSFFDDSGIIKINDTEITMGYFKNTTGMIVDIINKLLEFYKEYIIKDKNLDIHSIITIPYSLSLSGGKFKDKKSGYNITIPRGTKNYTTWSWDDYGKSYASINGKLTVKVIVEQPIKPKPTQKPQQVKKTNIQDTYLDCINCGKTHLNPKNDTCNFCGKSLTTKVQKKEIPLNDVEIDDTDLELIVTCINCNTDIKDYVSEICPFCTENIFTKKVENKQEQYQKVLSSLVSIKELKSDKKQIAKSKDTIPFCKYTTVKKLRDEFKLMTGLSLRVYFKNKIAENKLNINSIKGKDGEVKLSTRMKIKTIEDNFKEFDIKVQIASNDNKKLCDDKLSLAKAKEKYGEQI
ncbi:MAG: hypothetical protein U9Q04_07865 [Campylobacterota bacterium]|nr:hypothetical protein [Campylobacterota bacterium]